MLLAIASAMGGASIDMTPPGSRNPWPEPRPEPAPVRTAEDERRLEAARQKRARRAAKRAAGRE